MAHPVCNPVGVFCHVLLPGYHLVFLSNEVASCLPCERGRYNPVASSDSSGACRPCEQGDARPVIGRTWTHGAHVTGPVPLYGHLM